MTGKGLVLFIKQGWTALVDPLREDRLSKALTISYRELSTKRLAFDFHASVAKCELAPGDKEEVARRLFRKYLGKFWEDGEVSEKERKGLSWLAKQLEISELESESIQRRMGRDRFSAILARAFSDGHLDDSEVAELTIVAKSCGASLSDFFRSQFLEEGSAFLRSLFVNAIEDGRLDADEWKSLLRTVDRLGMSEAEFRSAISVPARQLLEHVLADARSDDEITSDEESVINWIADNLIADDTFTLYVRNQVAETQELMAIRAGRIPSMRAPQGLALNAGEVVHMISSGQFTYLKRRGDEFVPVSYDGTVVVTDSRWIFASQVKSFFSSHAKVLSFDLRGRTLEIQCAGAGAGTYRLIDPPRFAGEIWVAAIGRSKQTLVSSDEGVPSRHIPRDVRQRVWQKYSGRCAECAATDYLEFDHVIPHSRGGSNSDNNIQLLCRRCNLKKSDRI